MILQTGTLLLEAAHAGLAGQVTDYYIRNKEFLKEFEPCREENYFTGEFQKRQLQEEEEAARLQTAHRFYIKRLENPDEIIGAIGLNNIIWGSFRSAFLSYKLDCRYINTGCMTSAIAILVEYAFSKLRLHRIEANVMPRNKASLRVLEKNGFEFESLARFYLYINGIWEDHIHMVKINHDLHVVPDDLPNPDAVP